VARLSAGGSGPGRRQAAKAGAIAPPLRGEAVNGEGGRYTGERQHDLFLVGRMLISDEMLRDEALERTKHFMRLDRTRRIAILECCCCQIVNSSKRLVAARNFAASAGRR
jgi:hypothetical protein